MPLLSTKRRPAYGRRAGLFFASTLGGLLVAACGGDGEDQVVDPVVVGLSSNTAAFYDDGETTIYQAATQVILPMRRAKPEEQAALGKAEPFPSAPFLNSSDVEITIRYTLTNLDTEKRVVELIVDPWNEFVRYRPGIRVGEEGTTPDFSGFDKFFVIPPKSRIQGTLTPDDTRELAIDLATAENILAKPPADPAANVNGMLNRLFYLQNRSSVHDPLISPYVPSVTPGLTGLDVGLRTYQTSNVALEVLVDVVDLQGDRTTKPGDVASAMGLPPAELTPPSPPVMP